MIFLSRPPDTINMSVIGESARHVAGDWWTLANSTKGVLLALETVFQAATVPLSKAAASSDVFTELIFKSRKDCGRVR